MMRLAPMEPPWRASSVRFSAYVFCVILASSDRGEKDVDKAALDLDTRSRQAPHALPQRHVASALNADERKMHVQVRSTGNAAIERPSRTKGKTSAIEEHAKKVRNPAGSGGPSWASADDARMNKLGNEVHQALGSTPQVSQMQTEDPTSASSSTPSDNNDKSKASTAVKDTAAASVDSSMQDSSTDTEATPIPEDKGSTEDNLAREENNLQWQERWALDHSIDTLALAVKEPREFLLSLPGMGDFVSGLKDAVALQVPSTSGTPQCLQTSDFAGFGCAQDGKSPPICNCAGMLEHCWVETNEDRIIKAYSNGDKERAWTQAKALLFGQCYTPTWLKIALVVLVLLLLSAGGLLTYMFVNRKEGEGIMSSFPSLAAALSSFTDKFRNISMAQKAEIHSAS